MGNIVRDNFSQKTKELLAERAGFTCSNPSCRVNTSGASINNLSAVVRVGEAAHICAAAPNGARYDKNQSSDERSGYNNGIWLCATCATMIDKDPSTYTVMVLLDWKKQAELRSNRLIGMQSYQLYEDIHHAQDTKRIQLFLQYISNLLGHIDPDSGEHRIAIDGFRINMQVYARMMAFDRNNRDYTQNYRAYDASAMQVQDKIMDFLDSYKNFLSNNKYHQMNYDQKIVPANSRNFTQQELSLIDKIEAQFRMLEQDFYWLQNFCSRGIYPKY